MLRIALYARVSTNKHKCRQCRRQFKELTETNSACPHCGSEDIERSQNPDTQVRPLRSSEHSRKANQIFEYLDRESSGKLRPRLEALKADARRHKFDMVVVLRFDRFARSVKELILVAEEFKRLGIQFVSLTEGIDTSTPIGEFFFHIIAAFAQFERAIIKERTRLGHERARAEGKRIGRPSVLVDKQRLLERLQSGASISQVAREHGISRPTVRQIAKSLDFHRSEEKSEIDHGENPITDCPVSD